MPSKTFEPGDIAKKENAKVLKYKLELLKGERCFKLSASNAALERIIKLLAASDQKHFFQIERYGLIRKGILKLDFQTLRILLKAEKQALLENEYCLPTFDPRRRYRYVHLEYRPNSLSENLLSKYAFEETANEANVKNIADLFSDRKLKDDDFDDFEKNFDAGLITHIRIVVQGKERLFKLPSADLTEAVSKEELIKNLRQILEELYLISNPDSSLLFNNVEFLKIGKNGAEEFSKADFQNHDMALRFISREKLRLLKYEQEQKELVKSLTESGHKFRQRIWAEYDQEGKATFYTKVKGKIYASSAKEDLINLIQGRSLVEGEKPLSFLELTRPDKFFGLYNLVSLTSSNKSLIHYNFHAEDGKFTLLGGRKKRTYKHLIQNDNPLRVIVDGADITSQSLSNSNLDSVVLTTIQSLLLLPGLLKTLYFGSYTSLHEAEEIKEKRLQFPIKQAEIDHEIAEFRKELCQLTGLDYEDCKDDAPQQLIAKIDAALAQDKNVSLADSFASNEEEKKKVSQDTKTKVDEISRLCNLYQHRFQEKPVIEGFWKLIFTWISWSSTISLGTGLGLYNAQYFTNLASNFISDKNIASELAKTASTLSSIGIHSTVVGALMMTLYACRRVYQEGIKLEEVKKELQQIANSQEISQLALDITTKILEAKKDNYIKQWYGNALIALGQSLIVSGTLTGAALNPAVYAGMAVNILGIGLSSKSQHDYESIFGVSSEFDPLQDQILKEPPQFSCETFSSFTETLKSHCQRQIFALEILGHLRAPRLVLYQILLELKEHKAENSWLFNSALLSQKEIFEKWAQSPTQENLDFLRKSPLLQNLPHDLLDHELLSDFQIKSSDQDGNSEMEFIWKLANHLSRLHDLKNATISKSQKNTEIKKLLLEIDELRARNYGAINEGSIMAAIQPLSSVTTQDSDTDNIDEIHRRITTQIQEDFIAKKITAAQARKSLQSHSEKSMMTVTACTAIIKRGGNAATYLKEKILRAHRNGEIKLKKGKELEVKKIRKKTWHVYGYEEVTIVEFNLEKFEEEDLANFLAAKRPKKLSAVRQLVAPLQKPSPLIRAEKHQSQVVQANHLGPFSAISSVNKAKQFLPQPQQTEALNPQQNQTPGLTIHNRDFGAFSREVLAPFTPGANNQDSSALSTESSEELQRFLEKFAELAKLPIAAKKEERNQQIDEQKAAIQSLSSKCKPFILKARQYNQQKKETVFYYEDPNYPGSKQHQIIYIRNEVNNKIKVVYSDLASAIIIRPPEIHYNVLAVNIQKGNVTKHGDERNSIFTFEKAANWQKPGLYHFSS